MAVYPDSNYARSMLQAVLKWFADAEYPRAHFLINTDVNQLPEPFQRTVDEFGHVIMNLSWQATRDMEFDDEGVSFSCKSNGFPYNVYIYYQDILGHITNHGLVLQSYIPNTVEPEQEVKVERVDIDTSYQPKMNQLKLSNEEVKEVRTNTERHLKLIQNHRKPVVEQPVDPKNPSYPFPVDRFAEYNHKHKERETIQDPRKDVIFHGTPGGIQFHSRKVKPRVRPAWMTVYDGGQP